MCKDLVQSTTITKGEWAGQALVEVAHRPLASPVCVCVPHIQSNSITHTLTNQPAAAHGLRNNKLAPNAWKKHGHGQQQRSEQHAQAACWIQYHTHHDHDRRLPHIVSACMRFPSSPTLWCNERRNPTPPKQQANIDSVEPQTPPHDSCRQPRLASAPARVQVPTTAAQQQHLHHSTDSAMPTALVCRHACC
jgi:hypothetical protein